MNFIPYIDPEQKPIAVRNDEMSMDLHVHTVAEWSAQLPPEDAA